MSVDFRCVIIKRKHRVQFPHKRKTTQHSMTAVDILNSVSVFEFRQAERV